MAWRAVPTTSNPAAAAVCFNTASSSSSSSQISIRLAPTAGSVSLQAPAINRRLDRPLHHQVRKGFGFRQDGAMRAQRLERPSPAAEGPLRSFEAPDRQPGAGEVVVDVVA